VGSVGKGPWFLKTKLKGDPPKKKTKFIKFSSRKRKTKFCKKKKPNEKKKKRGVGKKRG